MTNILIYSGLAFSTDFTVEKHFGQINHVVSTNKDNRYTLKNAIKDDLPWVSTIRSLLESKGMLVDYIRTAVNEYHPIHKNLFQRLPDEFHQHAFEKIRRGK